MSKSKTRPNQLRELPVQVKRLNHANAQKKSNAPLVEQVLRQTRNRAERKLIQETIRG